MGGRIYFVAVINVVSARLDGSLCKNRSIAQPPQNLNHFLLHVCHSTNPEYHNELCRDSCPHISYIRPTLNSSSSSTARQAKLALGLQIRFPLIILLFRSRPPAGKL